MRIYRVILVIFLYSEASTEAKTTSINDLTHSGQDLQSAISSNGHQIVQKLTQIVEALRVSNQKVSHSISLN